MGPLLCSVQGDFYSDNLAVVHCLESWSAKDCTLAHLFRCLFFFLAQHEISYRVFHNAGKNNRAADALSRDELHVYFSIFSTGTQESSLGSYFTHVSSAGQHNVLDFKALKGSVQSLFARGLAESSKSTYSTVQHRYNVFLLQCWTFASAADRIVIVFSLLFSKMMDCKLTQYLLISLASDTFKFHPGINLLK